MISQIVISSDVQDALKHYQREKCRANSTTIYLKKYFLKFLERLGTEKKTKERKNAVCLFPTRDSRRKMNSAHGINFSEKKLIYPIRTALTPNFAMIYMVYRLIRYEERFIQYTQTLTSSFLTCAGNKESKVLFLLASPQRCSVCLCTSLHQKRF